MEEDMKKLEELRKLFYDDYDFIKNEIIVELTCDEMTAIENLINKYKEQEKAIQSLTESGKETLAMINLMTKFINETGIHRRAYNCVFRNGECDECSCEHCIREFFRKKAKGE